MKLLCKIGLHKKGMLSSHLATVEDGMYKLWVVLACPKCKTLWKAGLAHTRLATEKDKSADIASQGFKWGN